MLKEKLKMMNGVLENGNYQLGQFKFANLPFERGEILFSKGFFNFGAARVTARAGNSSDRSSRRSFSVRSPR